MINKRYAMLACLIIIYMILYELSLYKLSFCVMIWVVSMSCLMPYLILCPIPWPLHPSPIRSTNLQSN